MEHLRATTCAPGGFKENEQSLVEHAAGCASCRGRAAGYEVLHQAILAWGNAPEPPVGLTERILAAASAPLPTARKWRMAASQRWLLAAAASILVVITAGVISRVVVDRARERELLAGHAVRRAASTGDRATAIPKLDHALASATDATWDLARSATEPAARFSRQLLDAATESNPAPASAASTVSVPSLESFAPDSSAAVATIQQVGDRLASGVRPLSSSARQAFGFLLGPVPSKPAVRPTPTRSRGA